MQNLVYFSHLSFSLVRSFFFNFNTHHQHSSTISHVRYIREVLGRNHRRKKEGDQTKWPQRHQKPSRSFKKCTYF